MKKPYMPTILGSFGRDCVLIILFQLYDSEAGLFASNQALFYQFMCNDHIQSPALFQKYFVHFCPDFEIFCPFCLF